VIWLRLNYLTPVAFNRLRGALIYLREGIPPFLTARFARLVRVTFFYFEGDIVRFVCFIIGTTKRSLFNTDPPITSR